MANSYFVGWKDVATVGGVVIGTAAEKALVTENACGVGTVYDESRVRDSDDDGWKVWTVVADAI